MRLFVIIAILAATSWSWELFSFDPNLLLLIWSASVVLFFSVVKSSKKILFIFCLFLIPILVAQWKTTQNTGLGYMSETDKYLFATRRSELSAVIPNLGRYLGSKPEYMFYKFEQNLLRSMDLNLYFFGSHPRERSGIKEFEKFSYLFLPFFIFGLLKLVKFSPWQLGVSLSIPLLVLAIAGQDNPIGPFSLLPFFSATIAAGVFNIIKKIKCH